MNEHCPPSRRATSAQPVRPSPMALLVVCLVLLIGRSGALAHAHEHDAHDHPADCMHCVLAQGVDHAVAPATALKPRGDSERPVPVLMRTLVAAVPLRASLARGPPAFPAVEL